MKSVAKVCHATPELTILVEHARSEESKEANRPVTQAFILTDILHDDSSAPLLKLAMKPVPGIDEPVALVSSRGLAVGADTNQLYQWHTVYDTVSSQEEDQEGEQAVMKDPVLLVS